MYWADVGRSLVVPEARKCLKEKNDTGMLE